MSKPIAPRFEITVLKNKSVSDAAQIPATDAVINFYRAGATVNSASTVSVPASPPDTDVPVSDPGQIAIGDTVRVDTGPGALTVSGVSADHLTVTNSSGSTIQLAPFTRLVPTSNPPNVYKDPLGKVSLGSSIAVDGVTARASAYLTRDRFDYDVAIPGQTPRLYVDGSGMLGRSDQRWTDLRDYGGNLQAAIDALPPDGGIVFVPRGTWLLTGGITVNTPYVTIMGEGPGSILKAATPNCFDLMTVNRTHFQLRDITLDGSASVQDPTGKSCLFIRGLGASGALILNVVLENVTITGAARCGLYMQDVIIFVAQGCHFDSNKGSGARVDIAPVNPAGATTTQFIDCTFNQNGDRGCEAFDVVVLTFRGCTFDGNRGGAADSQGNAIHATSCFRMEVLSSVVRNADTATTPFQFFLLQNCFGSTVDACTFDGGAVAAKRPVQAIRYAQSFWSRLSNCVGTNLGSFLAVFDSGSPDCVELGNAEVGQLYPRISCEADHQAQRLFGMSRRSLSVPCVATQGLLPTTNSGVLPGALAWIQDQAMLKVWDGTAWRAINAS